MRKSLLIEQNRELFDKLQIANLKLKRLNNENDVLKEKIEVLERSVKDLQNSAQSNAVISDDKVILCEDSQSDDVVSDTAVENEKIEFAPETEYGSEIIGEIVIQTSVYSEKITESVKENKKELLNLIIGRSEVAKSEILDIAMSDSAIENKKNMMNSVLDDTVEYFKSVIEQ